ncbi:MAG: hypothetical protein K9K21_02975 [Desulfotignum sp.]|nr:hypothetical protein [Desulfotignum sp.]
MYRIAKPPDPPRKPNRLPDGVVITNSRGWIIGAQGFPLVPGWNLFDFMATYKDYQTLKRAMLGLQHKSPQTALITALYNKSSADYFCQIYKTQYTYLIGGWYTPTGPVNISPLGATTAGRIM